MFWKMSFVLLFPLAVFADTGDGEDLEILSRKVTPSHEVGLYLEDADPDEGRAERRALSEEGLCLNWNLPSKTAISLSRKYRRTLYVGEKIRIEPFQYGHINSLFELYCHGFGPYFFTGDEKAAYGLDDLHNFQSRMKFCLEAAQEIDCYNSFFRGWDDRWMPLRYIIISGKTDEVVGVVDLVLKSYKGDLATFEKSIAIDARHRQKGFATAVQDFVLSSLEFYRTHPIGTLFRDVDTSKVKAGLFRAQELHVEVYMENIGSALYMLRSFLRGFQFKRVRDRDVSRFLYVILCHLSPAAFAEQDLSRGLDKVRALPSFEFIELNRLSPEESASEDILSGFNQRPEAVLRLTPAREVYMGWAPPAFGFKHKF